MDCKRADERLIDLLYEELGADERQGLEAHLQGCPRCAGELARLQGVLRLVRAAPLEEPSPEVNARIVRLAQAAQDTRAARAASAAGGFWRLLWSPALVAAMVALVVGAVGLVGYLELSREHEPGLSLATPEASRAERAAPAPVETEARPVAQAPEMPRAEEAALARDLDGLGTRGAKDEGGAFGDGEDRREQQPRGLESRPVAPKLSRRVASGPEPKPEPEPSGGDLDASWAVPPSKEPAGDRKGRAKDDQPADERRYAQPPPPRSDIAADSPRPAEPAPRKPGTAMAAPGAAKPADDAPVQKTPAARPAVVPAEIRGGAGAAAGAEKPGERDKAEQGIPAQAQERAQAEVTAAMETHDSLGDSDAEEEDRSSGEGASTRREKKKAESPGEELFQRGERLLSTGEPAAAAAAFQAFLAAEPGDLRAPLARFRLAKALFRTGRCAEAVQATRAALALRPAHPEAAAALLDQASCEVRLGRFEDAVRTYQRIEREHPELAAEARREIQRIQGQR